MPTKLTDLEFREKYKNIKNSEFYKQISEYKGRKEQIVFNHDINKGGCGKNFTVTPDSIFRYGIKCNCEKKNIKRDTESFKEIIKEKVGDEYSIIGEYINNMTKIKFRHNCEKCNNYEFEMRPNNFFNLGQRCPKCFGIETKTDELFKKEIFELVNNEYTVLGEYKNCHGTIHMRHNCEKCNNYEWEANIQHFLSGTRCPKCDDINRMLSYSYIKDEIYRLGLGEYELVSDKYINAKDKLDIYHKKCKQVIKISWNCFQQGTRCKCETEPKGETKIKHYLEKYNIVYTYQFSDNTCKHILPLSFDFFINKLNLLIEYDGSQHFSFQEHYHKSDSNFQLQLKRDQIKNQWCKDNGISLIRISYKDYNKLDQILDDIFKTDIKLHPKQYNSIYIYLPHKNLLLETGMYKDLPEVDILNE